MLCYINHVNIIFINSLLLKTNSLQKTPASAILLSKKGKVYNICAQKFSRVQLFATPWTIAHETPLSMGFSRQEYCSELSFPSLIQYLIRCL